MTEGLAIELACCKMRELGVGRDYLLRYRHFQILPGMSMELRHWNELMILLSPEPGTRVSSKTGIYDLSDQAISEQQYVFTGRITIENINMTKLPVQVKFLQVIPLLTEK